MDKPEKNELEKTESEKDLSENNESETASFQCNICLEKRFVAFRPPCGHAICGVCLRTTLETEGLHDKCGMCRADLPEYWDGYGRKFHNISDLKSEEFKIAAESATSEGNLVLLKYLLDQKKFAVDESVRVVGLQNRTDLNGSEGVITELFVTSEMHTVQLAERKKYKMKPKNLRHSKLEEDCLGIAAEYGHTKIVKFLAENKVDLNRSNNNGSTPIFIAAHNGHTEIVKFLAESNVDLDRAMHGGIIPIRVAAQKGHTEIVKILAESKADLNRAADDGATPIFIAACNGHTEIVKFLAEQNADLNREVNDGATPIMIAVAQGHSETVKLLIEENANVEESLLFIATTDEIKEILCEALEKK